MKKALIDARRRASALLSCGLLAFGSVSLRAENVSFPGGHLRVPEPVAAVGGGDGLHSAQEHGSGWLYSSAWTCERSRITLHLCVRAGHTEVHPSNVPLIRRSVEAALRGSSARLCNVGVVELPAGLAYRIECESQSAAGTMRQVQIIVSGRDTVLATFSGDDEPSRGMAATVATVAGTLRLDREVSLLSEAPAWLCGSCLGLLVVVISLGRWGRWRGDSALKSA